MTVITILLVYIYEYDKCMLVVLMSEIKKNSVSACQGEPGPVKMI